MQPCHLTCDSGALSFSMVKGEEELQKLLRASGTKPFRLERRLKEQQGTMSPALSTEGQTGHLPLCCFQSLARNTRK